MTNTELVKWYTEKVFVIRGIIREMQDRFPESVDWDDPLAEVSDFLKEGANLLETITQEIQESDESEEGELS